MGVRLGVCLAEVDTPGTGGLVRGDRLRDRPR
jgi:hypothetical protein